MAHSLVPWKCGARNSIPESWIATNSSDHVFINLVAVRSHVSIDLCWISRYDLVLALQGPVYRFAYRWCGNAQDAFVKS